MEKEPEPCDFRHRFQGGYVCWFVPDSLTTPCEYMDLCDKAREIMGCQQRRDGDE